MLFTKISRKFAKVYKFDNFKEFKDQMDLNKPTLSLMYFNADWNPRY
jgi:hypothetical protein